MNKPTKVLSTVALSLVLSLAAVNVCAEASNNGKVMWGKTELKIGQIGKVTVLKESQLVKLNSDGTLTTVRTLNKGDEYRVYQYKGQHGGLYGVGNGSYVQKDNAKVGNKIVLRYDKSSADGKQYFFVQDINEVNNAYKILEKIGFPLSESEFKKHIKESQNERNTIVKRGVQIFASTKDIDIKW